MFKQLGLLQTSLYFEEASVVWLFVDVSHDQHSQAIECSHRRQAVLLGIQLHCFEDLDFGEGQLLVQQPLLLQKPLDRQPTLAWKFAAATK